MSYLVAEDAVRLELFRVKPTTRRLYELAVRKFVSWCDVGGLVDAALSFDDLLYAYLIHLYSIRASKSSAVYVVYGVLLLNPSLKSSLSLSQSALAGWNSLRESVSWPPLPHPVMIAMACSLCKGGSWLAGVGMLLSFDCFLRVSELCNLEVGDVIFSGHPALNGGKGVALQLSQTKTGKNQFVIVRDTDVACLLEAAVADAIVSNRSHVFPFSPESFRLYMKAASSAVGVGSCGYVPHSLRHGGATQAFLMGETVEQIALRGRWKSNNSIRTYIQAGRALMALQKLPPRVLKFGDSLSKCLLQFFSKHSKAVALLMANKK